MAARNKLFNSLKRKILRRRISMAETLFGAVFICVLGLSSLWVLAQKDNFDPADRDVSFETLEKDSTGEVLWETPLKRWIDPSVAATGHPAAVDVGIFSPAILDNGWGLDGRVEVFDVSNVYEKINGAAEQYIAFGFKRLHYVTVASGEHFVTIELYDQGSFPNVLGVFAAQGGTKRDVVSDGDFFYYRTSIGVIGGFRNYYFKIAGNTEQEAVTGKAGQLLTTLAELPTPDNVTPLAYLAMTGSLGLGMADLAYQRVDVFQYDFLEDFWFGNVPGGDDSRYFVHQAEDAARAKDLFARFSKEQAYEHTTVVEESARVIMQHDYLETFFALEQNGDLIFGVEGAATRQAAEASLGHLLEALRGTES